MKKVLDFSQLLSISICLLTFLFASFTKVQAQASQGPEWVSMTGLSNGGAGSMTLQILPIPANCERKLIEAKLRISFDTGEDFEYGDNTFDASALVFVQGQDINNTPTFQAYLKPKINDKNPEFVNLMDVIDFHPEGGGATDHIVIYFNNLIINTSFPSIDFETHLRLKASLEKVYNYDEDNVSLTVVPVASPCIQNPVRLSWESSCTEIQNYEVQILRVYNEQPVGSTQTYGVNPAFVSSKLDWSRALRIETEKNTDHIDITLAEGTGYYVWRVRAIGSLYENGIADARNWGTWSSDPTTVDFDDSTDTDMDEAFYYRQFDSDKNWIYSRVFTEELKIGEKIQYANTLQQSKQSQSKINTQEALVVSQQVYDYYGRANISSLPAPIIGAAGQPMGFSYVNNVLTHNGTLYNPTHFDENTNYKKPDSINGGPVHAYYSRQNSDLQIPSAENYPFVQTLYGKDGRVRQQGGAGNAHRIGGVHNETSRTTITLYGGISDLEMVRLFGDEAEKTSNIYKVVTIDPNKVQSASYINEKGETIATALINSGGNPLLDTLIEANDLVTTDTLYHDAFVGDNTWVREKNVVLATSELNNSVRIYYKLNPNDIAETCTGFCVECEYKVTITIDNDDPDSALYPVGHPLHFPKSETLVFGPESCNHNWNNFLYDKTYTGLPLGTYKISRKIEGRRNNPVPINGITYPFVETHAMQVRADLLTQAYNDLAPIQAFIDNQDIEGLYTYLNVPANQDTGKVTVTAGCFQIQIPIERCPIYTCPANGPDFEGYLLNALDTAQVGLQIGDFIPGYTTGQWNQVIYNMLNDPNCNYTCTQLWDCWRAWVGSYYSMQDMAAQMPTSVNSPNPTNPGTTPLPVPYTFDFQDEFLKCVGYSIRGFTAVDFYPASGIGTSNYTLSQVGYMSHPYAYFSYTAGQNPACEASFMQLTNTTTLAAAVAAATPDDWNAFYGCVQNYVPVTPALLSSLNIDPNALNDPSLFFADSTAGIQNCHDLCELKFDVFMQDIIDAAHAASLTVATDTIVGTGLPIANPDISTLELYCLTQMLVDSCKRQCGDTTMFTFLHSFYMNPVHVSFPGPDGCPNGFGAVDLPVSTSDYVGAFLNTQLQATMNALISAGGGSWWGCIVDGDSLAAGYGGNTGAGGTGGCSPYANGYGNTPNPNTNYNYSPNPNLGNEAPPGNGGNTNGNGGNNGGGSGGAGNGSASYGYSAGAGGAGAMNDGPFYSTTDSCTYYTWYFNDTLAQAFPGFVNIWGDSLVLVAGTSPYFSVVGCNLYFYSDIGATPELISTSCDTTQCGPLCVAMDSTWQNLHDSDYIAITVPPCAQQWEDLVTSYINTQLDAQLQSKVDAFVDNYEAGCLAPEKFVDKLWIEYRVGDHHFTLYRYDRAGNLVATIPPKGVSSAWVSPPANRDVHPQWTMVTEYAYNSLKQLVHQQTPDGGLTRFYYDDIGRLRFSQNAQQVLDNTIAYTKYDNLSRVVEVGIAPAPAVLDNPLLLNDNTYPSLNTTERVFTVYTAAAPSIVYPATGSAQRFLQNRVSYSYNDEGNATYYSYDAHGNVEWLIQKVGNLPAKSIRYKYDLVSNKVLQLWLQEGQADQFMWRYAYDSDNRITMAETSLDGMIWDRDARYEYFLHGPLKRVLIGEDRVQGVDYTYTLGGWLKAMNHPSFVRALDPGKDGDLNTYSPFRGRVAQDVWAMMLSYYTEDTDGQRGDFYKRDNNGNASPFNASLDNMYHLYDNVKTERGALYNGNISAWTSNIRPMAPGNLMFEYLNGEIYRYDELNRIKRSDFRPFTLTTPVVGYLNYNIINSFATSYSYDGNGNILSLQRKDNMGQDIDNLTYHYTNGINRLDHVTDVIPTGTKDYDIDNQLNDNYNYDEIGNLVADAAEGRTYSWTAYGKLQAVGRQTGGVAHDNDMAFTYDAGGNRVTKKVTRDNEDFPVTTYYVRDAQGNVLATYASVTSHTQSTFRQEEIHLYGSDRLGIRMREGEGTSTGGGGGSGGNEDPQGEPSGERRLVVAEVMYDSRMTSDSALEENHAGEYILLQNVSEDSINLLTFELQNVVTSESVTFPDIVLQSGERVIIAYGDASQKTQFAMINAFPAARLDDPRLHWHWQTEMVMPDDESVLKLFEIQDSTLALRDEVKYGTTYNKTAENQSSDSILYVLKREAYERFQYTFDRPEFSKMGKISWEEWEDVPYIEGGNVWREVDLKRYELKDHLGNVRVIVSDLRRAKLVSGVPTDFTALIKHYSNYYPFGMEKPAMVWDKGSYRYGYQGQEVDNEMIGTSNAISYKYRVEDARLGRFFSIDPLSAKYPFYSPYAFSGNRVVDCVELEGLEPEKAARKWNGVEQDAGTHVQENAVDKTDGKTYNWSNNWDTGEWDRGIEVIEITASKPDFVGLSARNLSSASTSITNNQETNLTPLSKTNTVVGIAASGVEAYGDIVHVGDLYAQGYRNGTKGNYQLTGRNMKLFGKQPMTSATAPASNLAKYGSVIGKATLGVATVIDGVGVYNYNYNPTSKNICHPAKAGVNLGFGLLGLKVNPVAAGVYFGVDSFYPGGWTGDSTNKGAIRQSSDLIDENQKIIPDFNIYRDKGGSK